ncbi:MAG: response regulator [Cyanobacteria bacterium P01_C01_bin.120]
MTEKPHPVLLVVEDSDEDFEALGRIMRRTCDIQIPLKRCVDGDEALDFLTQISACGEEKNSYLPKLILLDLNLPGTDGREVLMHIKQDERLREIPVIVLTTSSNPRDVHACYQSGVNSYMVKPTNIEQFKALVRLFVDYWFKVVMLPNAV